MTTATRYLAAQVQEDLRRKMVFVAGPRQVGKTTLALSLPGAADGYLNWDVGAHRARILRHELPPGDLWVFDEVHKYRRWRNYLKGLYDGRRTDQRILVTGSGRLDLYRFGGDSLQGRYHLLRLHPFSTAELALDTPAMVRDLLRLGGFRSLGSRPARRSPGAGLASTPRGSFKRKSRPWKGSATSASWKR